MSNIDIMSNTSNFDRIPSNYNPFDINNWHILPHQKENGTITEQIYNENQDDDLDNGLLPRIWGPPTWKALHCISFGYPVRPTLKDKVHYKMFFKMIGYVLPCKSCRISYIKFIETGDTKITDDVFKDRRSLTYWLYKIHDAVNKKVGISYNISYEDLVEIYESFRAKCSIQDNNKCIAPTINKEAEAFRHEYKNECNIIPYTIAKCFKKYGKFRGIKDFNNLEQYKDLIKIKKTKIWNERNNECYAIIKYMRENGIPSLEKVGKFKGLPTIEELKLIARMSSNLHFDELKVILTNMGYQSEKKYKFTS